MYDSIHIKNDTIQTGLRLIGFVFVAFFIVLTVRLSWYFVFLAILSVSFLFIKYGYLLDFQKRKLVKYISIFNWERTEDMVFNNSYDVLVHKVNYKRPILQTLYMSFNEKRYESIKYRVTIKSEFEKKYLELPLFDDYSKMKNIVDKIKACAPVEIYTNF